MKLIGYLRISRDEEDSNSLDVQKLAIERYCQLHGHEITDWAPTDNGVSGGLPIEKRTGARYAICAVEAGLADGVIAAKLDRLTRSITDIARVVNLAKSGKHLIFVGDNMDTSTASGQMILAILTVVAAFERQRTAERVRESKALRAKRGEYLGGKAPFGYRVKDKVLVPVQEQQEILNTMMMLDERGESAESIAMELKARGMFRGMRRNRKSKVPVPKLWYPRDIEKLVKNERVRREAKR